MKNNNMVIVEVEEREFIQFVMETEVELPTSKIKEILVEEGIAFNKEDSRFELGLKWFGGAVL